MCEERMEVPHQCPHGELVVEAGLLQHDPDAFSERALPPLGSVEVTAGMSELPELRLEAGARLEVEVTDAAGVYVLGLGRANGRLSCESTVLRATNGGPASWISPRQAMRWRLAAVYVRDRMGE